MRNVKIEGIVIKRRNFGEADRILTLLTRKGEKIQIKALGVRKINSRRSPHIELLNHSLLTLYNGRNSLILTEAQTLEEFSKIKDNLIKVGFAYHICELIDGLCPENQENLSIFFLLKNTLKDLSEKEDIVTIIHHFEITLLTNLGFYPQNNLLKNLDTTSFIERILERKLRTKQFLPRLS